MPRPSPVVLQHLRTENACAPIALWTRRPRFSWQLVSSAKDVHQRAYQVLVRDRSGALIIDTGRVESSESVLVEVLSHDLAEAQEFGWQVRVWVGDDTSASEWAHARFETALFGEWDAHWIEPEQEPVVVDGATSILEAIRGGDLPAPGERLHPPLRIRQRIELTGQPARARLRATAHGVYSAEVNGRPASQDVLAPGYQSYQHSLAVHTHDITDLLGAGPNLVAFTLADGWYAGRISIFGRSAQYGDRLRLAWQLEVEYPDGSRQVFGSDRTARSSTQGPIRYSDLFIGEHHDARRIENGWSRIDFDETGWSPVRTVDVQTPLVPFIGEPIRRVRQIPAVEVITTPAGESVVDFGQVIAGRVRMRVTGAAGTTITLEHGEVLDADGNYLNNISGMNKDQCDQYTLAGHPAGETWEPEFTLHGFRYCRITGHPGPVLAEDFVGVVLANDLTETSGWHSDDARMNRLHQNVVWSQRGNFLAVPTDCPQRERAGWTGDAQIFMPTAATNADVTAFMSRWLTNLREDLRPDGGVPIIVPLPPALQAGFDAGATGLDGIEVAAGWSDAIVIIPHVLYRRFGDRRVLQENYPAMVAWVDKQRRDAAILPERLRAGGLSQEQERRQSLLWNGVLNFGDWLTPSTMDAADPSSIMAAPLRTGELVGPMFQVHALDLLVGIARVLGEHTEADDFAERAASIRAAFAAEYLDRGHFEESLQGLYVLALAFDLVPEQDRAAATGRLIQLVRENGNRLDTGFLSVPYLLDVLVDAGRADVAYQLAWQDRCPSWLYEVDRGATTIWEAWDAIAPDGTVGVMSFNHYAFGCIDDWLFRRLAGLVEAEPGFRRSLVTPGLDSPLRRVEAHLDTPYGRLGVDWHRDGDRARIQLSVPANTTSELALPPGWTGPAQRVVGSGSWTFVATRSVPTEH
ncbi:MAG: family 78 glycoside hydrolase catalytic domain [Actinomycetales bacterium]